MDNDTNDNPPPPGTREEPSRRNFLLMVGAAVNAVAAAMVGLPILGFVLSSFVKKPDATWISLGSTSQFPENSARMVAFMNPGRRPEDGDTAHIPVWVRRLTKDDYKVFAINCTHLGCPVRWFEESQLFLCPCHGGAFYADGAHAAGPPPRGLYEYEYKVENGELQIKGGYLPVIARPV